jgi:hypothetical protein
VLIEHHKKSSSIMPSHLSLILFSPGLTAITSGGSAFAKSMAGKFPGEFQD